jgi:hypothetical protein
MIQDRVLTGSCEQDRWVRVTKLGGRQGPSERSRRAEKHPKLLPRNMQPSADVQKYSDDHWLYLGTALSRDPSFPLAKS